MKKVLVGSFLVFVLVVPVMAQQSSTPTDPARDLAIRIPALARPALADVQKQFPWIKSIQEDQSPAGAVTLKLASVLESSEVSISSEEYEQRLAPRQQEALGFQQALWLVEHQDEFPEFMALAGKIYIDFPGLVMVDGINGRDFAFLVRHGSRWSLECGWSGRGADHRGRIAVGN